MKNILYKLVVTTGLAFGLISFSANAVLITSDGTWSNPQTSGSSTGFVLGAGINGSPSANTVSWGKGIESTGYAQSSWLFEGLNNFEAYTDGTVFPLGHFTHSNNPIYKGKFFGADLDLDLTMGGESSILSFTFGHWETLNSGYGEDGECPYGENPCADIVYLPLLTSTDTINIGGILYEMTLAGFEISEGVYEDHLVTGETYTNWAQLYASLSRVPEPSVIALFGIGLLGLGFASRRKANG